MAEVNPFEDLLGLGGQVQSFEDLVDRYRKLEWIVYQLRERTGGDIDIVETITNSETFETSTSAAAYQDRFEDFEQIEDQIVCPQPETQEDTYNLSKRWEARIAKSNYTAIDKDFVESRLNSTIKLDSKAVHNSQIVIGNGDGSKITIDGNGSQIRYKGNRTNCLIVRNEGTFIHFYKFIDGSEEYWRGA